MKVNPFSLFGAAVSDARAQAAAQAARDDGSRFHAPARWAAVFANGLEQAQRFYLPSARNVIDVRGKALYETDEPQALRLPYDTVALLTDCSMRAAPMYGVEATETHSIALAFSQSSPVCDAFPELRALPLDPATGLPPYFLMASTFHKHLGHWSVYPEQASFQPCSEGIAFFWGNARLRANTPLVAEPTYDGMQIADEVISTLNLVAMLGLANVGTTKLCPVGRLDKRISPVSGRPLFSYHILKVDNETWSSPESSSGCAGLRAHLRRGHIRRLPDTRRVWGRACFVRGSVPGFVHKDYDVKVAA